jgi:hypothetical protein
MGLNDWLPSRSQLQRALKRGMRTGGSLWTELDALDDYSISSRADAAALCKTLAHLISIDTSLDDPPELQPVIRMFLKIQGADCAAYTVLVQRGCDLLLKFVHDALDQPSLRDGEDVLSALEVLALFRADDGTEAVIRAAKLPLEPDSPGWSDVFQYYTMNHAGCPMLFRELGESLPDDLLGVALLECANTAKRSGEQAPHPFDSTAGVARLERYLRGRDEDYICWGSCAVLALPYIHGPERDALLSLAFDHSDFNVQLAAAQAAAEMGRKSGVEWLIRACLDPCQHELAKEHLKTLGQEDAIPTGTNDVDFQVRAKFADWLSDPRELNRLPDEVEIVDHRVLAWPPERQPISQWLVRYRVKGGYPNIPPTGIGLVGSMTFCFFLYDFEQRSPEDCYALHCYNELWNQKRIKPSSIERNSRHYKQVVGRCRKHGVSKVSQVKVFRISPELKYPQKSVVVAEGMREGQPGSFVFDGPRSRWYPESDMPDEEAHPPKGAIHIGRVLLGFPDEPDRRKFLKPASSPPPPPRHEDA